MVERWEKQALETPQVWRSVSCRCSVNLPSALTANTIRDCASGNPMRLEISDNLVVNVTQYGFRVAVVAITLRFQMEEIQTPARRGFLFTAARP